jgi:hypothetical protein
VSSEFTKLDLRELGMAIASAHDLLFDTVVAADEVAKDDDEFFTAICISADLDMLVKGQRDGPVVLV